MKDLKILIAPDKFKGSLSAMEVCTAITNGLKNRKEPITVLAHPLADGGDGSLEVIAMHLDLQKQVIETVDPLGRPIETYYHIGGQTAFVELAKASGLVLIDSQELNPLKTSTYGTGKMIEDAISKGCNNICLFLGGSATNDGGMGIASALGIRFLDEGQVELKPIGENLIKVQSIEVCSNFEIEKVKFTLWCDVNNPLVGARGAAQVYARQKGADDAMIQKLDEGLLHFSEQIFSTFGIEVAQLPGSGAAGGIAAALVSIFKATIESGIENIMKYTELEAKIQEADIIISGEGRLDKQSLEGKVIDGVATLCQKYNKPLFLFIGENLLSEKSQIELGLNQVFPVLDQADSREDSIKNASYYLTHLGAVVDLREHYK